MGRNREENSLLFRTLLQPNGRCRNFWLATWTAHTHPVPGQPCFRRRLVGGLREVVALEHSMGRLDDLGHVAFVVRKGQKEILGSRKSQHTLCDHREME